MSRPDVQVTPCKWLVTSKHSAIRTWVTWSPEAEPTLAFSTWVGPTRHCVGTLDEVLAIACEHLAAHPRVKS